MRSVKSVIALLIITVIFSACNRDTDYVVVIKTDYGDMKAILYDETPGHKQNFIRLAQEGFFDSLLWHRVMKDFMIQGGDNLSRHAKPGEPIGRGGAPYFQEAEIVPKFYHERGAIAAARMPDGQNPEKKSNGSQFYIVQGKTFTDEELDEIATNVDAGTISSLLYQILNRESLADIRSELNEAAEAQDNERYKQILLDARPVVEKEFGRQPETKFTPEQREIYKTIGGAPHLDGGYTVFGKVVEGMDVVDKIAAQPTDERARPTEDIRMWISLEEVPKAEITKKYGYEYPEPAE